MGQYFGKPWETDFEEKEKNYLQIEKNLMHQNYGTKKILDLTGSCIYHPRAMEELAKTGLVIYLQTSPEHKKALFENYKIDPKAVCWNKIFKPQEGETNQQTLERCYHELLNYREKQYEKYANTTIESKLHKNAKNLEEFMEAVYEKLEK